MKKIRDLKTSKSKFLKFDIIQELFFSGIGCIIVIIIYHLFPNYFHFSKYSLDSRYPTLILFLIVFFFLLIFFILNQPHPKKNFFKSNYKRNIILFSIFNFSIIFFLFFNTNYSNFGLKMDNWYRSTTINQMATSGYPKDYCYKGLSAYYFPLYYYSLALIARFFRIAPFKMLRYGFLFLSYLLPILLYEVWKKIYDKKISFIISVLSISIFMDVFQIDKVIVYLFIIPYFIYYFENYSGKIFKKKNYILAGIFGAILLTMYLTFFLIIPIYYIILLFQNKREFVEKFWHVFKIFLLISVFSSWYLIPLARDYLIFGFEVHQNNFFKSFMSEIPFFTQIFPFSLLGIIFFIGFMYIIKNYSISHDFKILGNLLLSVIIVIFIGFIGFALKRPFFLSYRFFKIPKYIIIISFSIFHVKFFQFLSHNGNRIIKTIHLRFNFQIIKLFIIIVIVSFQIYNNNSMAVTMSHYQDAHKESIPEDKIAIIGELDYEDKVFLTNYDEVCPYIPIYLFLCPIPDYSHPSAYHNQRIKFLEKLAESQTSKSFYDKILDCEFDIIDYFYLKPHNNSGDFQYSATYDKFNDRDEITIIFERRLFEDPDKFIEIEIDGEIIYKTKY